MRIADESVDDLDEVDGPGTSGRTLIVVSVFLALALMLALPARSWLSQRTELGALRVKIDQASARVQDLQRKQELWQNDAYVAAQARLRLNMVKPGEAGLVLLDPEEETVETPRSALPTTWWAQLWESVESSTGRTGQVEGPD